VLASGVWLGKCQRMRIVPQRGFDETGFRFFRCRTHFAEDDVAKPAWKRPGSPIGKKGPRKANPKYIRKAGEPWSAQDMKDLKKYVKENMPTRVIGLKLQRPEGAVRAKAQREGISLKPVNQSPNKGRTRA